MFARSCASCAPTTRRPPTRAVTALHRAHLPPKFWISPCTTSMLWCAVRLLCRRRVRVAPWLSLTDRGTGSRAAKYFRYLELAVSLRSTYRLDDRLDPCHHRCP